MRIRLDINAFALGLLLALAWSLPASAEFMFDPKKTALSDVQYEEVVSGDKEAATVLFENFTVELAAHSPAVQSRAVSFVLATKGEGDPANLAVTLRGSIGLEEGTSAVVLVRLPGLTEVFQPAESETSGFEQTYKVAVKPGSDIPVTVFLMLERSSGDGQALMTLSSVDIGIPVPETAPAKPDCN